MPTASSFDITSPVDFQEVDNALNQARKEVGQRYDFKGVKADIELNTAEKTLTLTADDDFKVTGTPSFIIDGKVYGGALSMDELNAILKPLIK